MASNSENGAHELGVIAPKLQSFTRYQTVIFDLSLITENRGIDAAAGNKDLQRHVYEIKHSPAWADFERGFIDLPECIAQLMYVLKDCTDDQLDMLVQSILNM